MAKNEKAVKTPANNNEIKAAVAAMLVAAETLKKVYLLIVAGGNGTRLFPISNVDCAKQFTTCGDTGLSFLGVTVKRYVSLGLDPKHVIVLVCTDRQHELANEKLAELKEMTGIDVPQANVYQISQKYGYAGAMVEGVRYIHGIDNDSIVISTPADQYVEVDAEFGRVVSMAIKSAEKHPTIIGVKTTDLNIMVGCGHAIYDRGKVSKISKESVPDRVVEIIDFVEKPDKETANLLLAAGNSAVNTGINVFRSAFVAKKFQDYDLEKGELATDVFMEQLGKKVLAIGFFRWEDCGTLKSLRKICTLGKTHHNATIANGSYVERTDCMNSLFVTTSEADLYATNCEDVAVCIERIRSKLYIAVVALEDSQKVRELAESYREGDLVLSSDYSVAGARNNLVVASNCSTEIIVGFCGLIVCGYIVNAVKTKKGRYLISVSRQKS